MINILSLLTITLGLAAQSVSQKLWNRKNLGGTMAFSAGSVFFALLTFLVSAFWGFELNIQTIFYSVLFAAFYSMSVIFSILAISKGPLSITSLIYSFSLIIPTFYGLFVLKEESSLSLYIGLVCLAISLCLINIEEKGEKKETNFTLGRLRNLGVFGERRLFYGTENTNSRSKRCIQK